jgi:hypothetical protein
MITNKMQSRIVIFFLFLCITATYSCKKNTEVKQRVAVAKVYDTYLYLSDIKHIFPEKVTKQDSIQLATTFINTWIKTQLLLRQAENNLTPEQRDVDQQVLAYKSSLLIYKYEEQMLAQKVDTVVKDAEIEEYYNNNTPNFVLEENLVKALFLKIPKTAPDIDKVKIWYKSENIEEYKKLDSYCYNYAVKYHTFNDNWVVFNMVQLDLPHKIENEDEFLKNNSYIEQEDNEFYYFILIKNKNQKGSLAPLTFVRNKINDIIINKRKVEFLNNLESNIFNDAQKNYEIYNLDKK